MYSSYWKPQDGRESTVLTDHEALHRDAATHKSIQSDETKLRPLDLETIMSSKAAVKFWYLHRPKTMEYVHKNATKIQSVGRAFAVRQLKKKYGIEYMVELAKQDALRREADKLKDLDEAGRAELAAADAAYDARVEESRRLRREQMEKEREAENALRHRLAEEAKRRQDAEEARLAAVAAAEAAQRLVDEEERLRQEEARLAQLEEEERLREEAEAVRIAEEARRAKEAEEAEARRLKEEEEEEARLLAAAALAEQQRREEEEAAAYAAQAAALAAEAEKLRLEEERIRMEEEAAAEEERRLWEEEEAAAAAVLAAAEQKRREEEEALARREREETERALAAAALEAQKVEQARQQRLKEEKEAKYEQSLSKDVPVLVRNHGPGRVVSYDQDAETYQVRLDNAMGGMQINVKSSDVNLDDDRILSPRTKVDTPFGTGEVVGLDPHVGCYAINTEVNAPDGEQFLAFVQINDVHVHVEEVEERAIVENPSMPSTFSFRRCCWSLFFDVMMDLMANMSCLRMLQFPMRLRWSRRELSIAEC